MSDDFWEKRNRERAAAWARSGFRQHLVESAQKERKQADKQEDKERKRYNKERKRAERKAPKAAKAADRTRKALGDPTDVQALTNALSSKEFSVRSAAITALADLNSAVGQFTLANAARDPGLDDLTRGQAAAALARFGGGAVDELKALATERGVPDLVRHAAVMALEYIGD